MKWSYKKHVSYKFQETKPKSILQWLPLHQWLLPIPMTAPYTNDCSLHQWLLPIPMTAPYTNDCSLHQWLLPTPMTAPYTNECPLYQWLLPTPMTAPYTNDCSLHQWWLPTLWHRLVYRPIKFYVNASLKLFIWYPAWLYTIFINNDVFYIINTHHRTTQVPV